MVLTVLECLAVWFIVSVPFSLLLGAFLARRDAPARRPLPGTSEHTRPSKPVASRYEVVK
jgi:hypothetical protein